MNDKDAETRLVVLKCPEDLVEELNVLSQFNAVSLTEFVGIMILLQQARQELLQDSIHLIRKL